MLKIIKAMPIALLTLVPNYSANEERTVYFEAVTTSGNSEYIRIRPLYTVTKQNSLGMNLVYSYSIDGNNYDAGSCYISSLNVVKGQVAPTLSNKIMRNTLGIDNSFTVEMIPDDPTLARETVTLHKNQYGSKVVYYKEKNNNGGLSSGFISQSYNVDPKLNSTREDRIIFSNFEDNKIISTYNYFDISEFNFKYVNAASKKPVGEFYFDFIDTFAIFEDLPLVPGSMYRRLPLECIMEDEVCYFTLKNSLYYDPITHKTSSTSKDGYYPTRKLYFPIDSFDYLKRITCRIEMDIVGFTEFTMMCEFKISHEKKLFGECEDSEYCIHSSEEFNPNKREKEIEVNI